MMIRRIAPLLLLAALVGCSSRDADLKKFIEQTKAEQPGAIEQLPEPKPNESFVYDAAGKRSPFVPFAGASAGTPGLKPKLNRNKEFLEQYPLEQLSMGGTMSMKGKTYGVVKIRDAGTQLVQAGNYLGQFEGRITKIEPAKISITEIVPDGTGGYMERSAALTLNDE